MSSNHETARTQRKKPEQASDLSSQYRRIGIKAVAAAAAKRSEGANSDQKPKQSTREEENANG